MRVNLQTNVQACLLTVHARHLRLSNVKHDTCLSAGMFPVVNMQYHFLAWHARWSDSQNHGIYRTSLSGKEPVGSVWKRGSLFKKYQKVIRQMFSLPHSIQANQTSSLRLEPVDNSAPLSGAPRGATLTSQTRLAEKQKKKQKKNSDRSYTGAAQTVLACSRPSLIFPMFPLRLAFINLRTNVWMILRV